MSRLSDAIDNFKPFSNQVDINNIRNQLKLIQKKTYAGDIEQLRVTLLSMLSSPITATKPGIIQPIHSSLIVLAQIAPLNQIDGETHLPSDVTTHMSISLKDRVVISSGHQFDINALVEFHRARPRRGNEVLSKALLNPLTNIAFNALDAVYILDKVKKRGLTLDDKKCDAPLNSRVGASDGVGFFNGRASSTQGLSSDSFFNGLLMFGFPNASMVMRKV